MELKNHKAAGIKPISNSCVEESAISRKDLKVCLAALKGPPH